MESAYRGHTICRHPSGDGRWVIYNTLGHQIGGAFNTAWSAMTYIDERLSP